MTPHGKAFHDAYGRLPTKDDVGKVYVFDDVVYRVSVVTDDGWTRESIGPPPNVVRVDLGAAYDAALTLVVGVGLGLSLGAWALAVAL